MKHILPLLIVLLLAPPTVFHAAGAEQSGGARQQPASTEDAFVLPYFQGNGEAGVYFAWSRDGLKFESLNDGKVMFPAPDWGDESLTRDPSIVYRNGVFHMVWTTSWWSRTFGYARSTDLRNWTARKIEIWGEDAQGIRNTWSPELHWDAQKQEFLIIWSTTTEQEKQDGDGSIDPHNLDHRTYATRTRDFASFTKPQLFFSPDPEFSVIDPYIAHDDRDTPDNLKDDRWIMVIKHEMAPKDGGKNLRLTFSVQGMQGPYKTTLSPPVVGAGTGIVNHMGEGPSLLKHQGEWWLYWDSPGSRFAYCLATSSDLKAWKNRSAELSMPISKMRHGTVFRAPPAALHAAGSSPREVSKLPMRRDWIRKAFHQSETQP